MRLAYPSSFAQAFARGHRRRRVSGQSDGYRQRHLHWGTRWVEDGEVYGENCGHNWYNCNALAAAALYRPDEYVQEVKPR